jgi:hypothetical protein
MQPNDTTEPDGYYGDDAASDEELDLSFLDENEDQPKK